MLLQLALISQKNLISSDYIINRVNSPYADFMKSGILKSLKPAKETREWMIKGAIGLDGEITGAVGGFAATRNSIFGEVQHRRERECNYIYFLSYKPVRPAWLCVAIESDRLYRAPVISSRLFFHHRIGPITGRRCSLNRYSRQRSRVIKSRTTVDPIMKKHLAN